MGVDKELLRAKEKVTDIYGKTVLLALGSDPIKRLHTMGDNCIVQDIDDYISSITGNRKKDI